MNRTRFFRYPCLAILVIGLLPVLARPGNGVRATVAFPSVFEQAAKQNAGLQESLTWFFGSKTQRGWSLYVPLIRRLIQTDAEADSPEFAAALSRWQQRAGLSPDGVLDNGTWMQMVATFQARRIKARGTPPPDQLTLVPPSELYDPARPVELRQVDRIAYAAYQRMIAAAAADPALKLAVNPDGRLAASETYLKIISAFRSPMYQAALRRQSPHSGRAGLAVNSPHFTGRALDLYVGGEPVSTKDDNRARQVKTPIYLWLVKNAERFGFHPYFYEPWHWEYLP